MDKHNAQEVQEPARAPEVLKLTAAAMRRDVRALDILASVLDQPESVQLDAFIEKLAEYAQEAQEPTGEQLAFSLPDYSPELDPAGAAFDPAAYRQAIAEAGGWQSFKTDLRDEMRDIYGNLAEMGRAAAAAFKNSPGAKAAANLANNPGLKAATERALQQAAILQKALRDFWESPEMKRSRESLAEVIKNVEAIAAEQKAKAAEQWPEYADAPEQIQEIAVYIQAELTDAEAEGLDLEGATLSDIMAASFTEEWEPIKTSPYYDNVVFRAMERARGRAEGLQWAETLARSEEPEAEGGGSIPADLPQIIANDLVNIPYPVDKSNSLVLWNADAWQTATMRSQVPGQLSFPVLFEEKQQAAATFIYSFPAENFDLPKNFDQYDRRVYFAVSAIYHQLGPDMTIRQIFKTMTGSDTNPSKADRSKINKSLLKMRAAAVDVDCSAEIKAFQKEYKKRGVKIENPVYNDILLDWSSFRGKVNGKDAEIIHIKSEPLLFNFARVRGEITTIDRKLLETPSGMNLTKQVIALQDYLIYQISLKNGPAKRKLAYTTIEERCNIKGKDAKRRARGTVKDLLQDFKIKGFIVSWREYKKDGKPEGVEITRKAAQCIEQ